MILHPAEDPRRQLLGHARGAVRAARHRALSPVPAGAGRLSAQTVADVNSRVASARAAIAQLRTAPGAGWLGRQPAHGPGPDQRRGVQPGGAAVPAARAGALRPRYGTVSVLLVSKRPPPAARPVKLAGGFTGGLRRGLARAAPGDDRGCSPGRGAVAAVRGLRDPGGPRLRGRRWLARRCGARAPRAEPGVSRLAAASGRRVGGQPHAGDASGGRAAG